MAETLDVLEYNNMYAQTINQGIPGLQRNDLYRRIYLNELSLATSTLSNIELEVAFLRHRGATANDLLTMWRQVFALDGFTFVEGSAWDLRRLYFSQFTGAWTPSSLLEGQSPSLWLRADQGVYTGGSRQFYVADKGSLDLTGAGFDGYQYSDITITGWFYADAVNVDQTIVADYHSHLTTKRWKLWISSSGNLTFTAGLSTTLNAGAVSANTWYFFAARIETSTGNIYVSVNNAAESSNVVGYSATGTGSLSRFSIGSTIDGSNTLWFGGRVAKIGIFGGTITSAERTYLYNTGNGRVYGELGVAGTDGSALTDSRLKAYYNLNEVAGTSTALDAHSTNDLTPTFVELLSNTGFETAGGGGADVFGSWTEVTAGTGTIADEGVIVDAGSHAAKLTGADGSNYSQIYQTVMTVGHRYTYSVRSRYDTSGKMSMYLGGGARTDQTLTGSYATYSVTGTCLVDGRAYLEVLTNGATAYFDTASVKAVDIPAADGPESEIAADSVASAHGLLANFGDPDTAWSSDKPTPITALVNGSLTFDGTNDTVKCGTTGFDLTTAVSLSCWIKTTSAAVTAACINKNGGYFYIGIASGKARGLVFTGGNDTITGGTTVNDGSWHHICMTWSSATNELRLYVDGASDATAVTTTGNINSSASDIISLGGDFTNATLYYGGSLSDARVYSTQITAANVASLYAGTDFTTGLVSRWKLDDGPQTGIADGDPVIEWRSIEGSNHQFQQATASKRPLYVASGINSKPAISFDGTDDILVKASSFLTGTAGTVIVVLRTGASLNDFMGLLGVFDSASNNKFIIFRANANAGNQYLEVTQQDADTQDAITGSSVIATSTNYVHFYASSGTAYSLRVNGNNETEAARSGSNSGDWFSDTSSLDDTAVGASKFGLAGESQWFKGYIAEIIVYPINLSAASIAKISAYTTSRYSIAA